MGYLESMSASTTIIYRIENPANGLGPYREWKHATWMSERHSKWGDSDHPTPDQLHWWTSDTWAKPHLKFAFSSLDALYLWFGVRERILMKGYGFKVVTMEIDEPTKICYQTGQVMFDTFKAERVNQEEIDVNYN